jgi:hypothetical protein
MTSHLATGPLNGPDIAYQVGHLFHAWDEPSSIIDEHFRGWSDLQESHVE